MKRTLWAAAMLLIMCGAAAAALAQENGEDTAIPSLETYGGIVFLTAILVEVIKGAFKKLKGEKGKLMLLALLLCVALGIVSKLASISFSDVEWGKHICALVTAAITSGLLHDKILSPGMKWVKGLFAKKEDGSGGADSQPPPS